MQTEKMTCPICQMELTIVPGDSVDRTNGVTVYCANKACSAEAVAGHGKDEDAAFKIVQEKFPVKKVTKEA